MNKASCVLYKLAKGAGMGVERKSEAETRGRGWEKEGKEAD